eukprot:5409474-Alexandrium_andersonii.AAC.1
MGGGALLLSASWRKTTTLMFWRDPARTPISEFLNFSLVELNKCSTDWFSTFVVHEDHALRPPGA